MAAACGIDVPPSRIAQVGQEYHTFMVQRFDRVDGARKFFTSAMTILNKTDKDEASYIDLAQFIAEQGSPVYIAEDLKQLFRRVAFNIAIANRDDHLRNHGFIRTLSGWRLSKAYDMNPSVKKPDHVLGIDEGLHEPSLRNLLETALYYDLSEPAALQVIDEVLAVVATWRSRAKGLRISLADIEEMDDSFITALE